MPEGLLPLLALGGARRPGLRELLPLLLLGGGLGDSGGSGWAAHGWTGDGGGTSGDGSGSGGCSSSGSGSSSTDRRLASKLTEQLKRFVGCRAKFVLETSTLYPGGQLVIARLCAVEDDYVFVDRIEVNGVPSVDPSFLFLGLSEIVAFQPIPRIEIVLESLFRLG